MLFLINYNINHPTISTDYLKTTLLVPSLPLGTYHSGNYSLLHAQPSDSSEFSHDSCTFLISSKKSDNVA